MKETSSGIRAASTPRRRAVLAGVLVLTLALAALLGPMLYDKDPNLLDLARAAAPPGDGHPLGTDESGRDVLGRLLAGGRVSLAVGFAAVTCSALLGLSLGALAALGGRRVDTIVMRFTDAMMAIPALFLIITTLALFGTNVAGLVFAIGATSWMGLARLVRAELMSIREQNYFEAARALGARPVRVLLRHALPHLLPGVLVNITFGVGTAILMESALSFIGLGIQPPEASWGNMLTNAQTYLYASPWLAVYPGLLILITVVAVNVLGDALRDVAEPASDRGVA
ncbi:MAG TPA: ABC transporter permease [Gemmatimonadaceae bacterium]